MQSLKNEIERCLFLTQVLCDFGEEYKETVQLLFQDVLDAIAIQSEGELFEQLDSLVKLREWA